MDYKTIASSSSKDCVDALQSLLGYDGMYIHSSNSYFLRMPLIKYNELNDAAKEYIDDFSEGFVNGWEMALEKRNN